VSPSTVSAATSKELVVAGVPLQDIAHDYFTTARSSAAPRSARPNTAIAGVTSRALSSSRSSFASSLEGVQEETPGVDDDDDTGGGGAIGSSGVGSGSGSGSGSGTGGGSGGGKGDGSNGPGVDGRGDVAAPSTTPTDSAATPRPPARLRSVSDPVSVRLKSGPEGADRVAVSNIWPSPPSPRTSTAATLVSPSSPLRKEDSAMVPMQRPASTAAVAVTAPPPGATNGSVAVRATAEGGSGLETDLLLLWSVGDLEAPCPMPDVSSSMFRDGGAMDSVVNGAVDVVDESDRWRVVYRPCYGTDGRRVPCVLLVSLHLRFVCVQRRRRRANCGVGASEGRPRARCSHGAGGVRH
jgi:hypothetical protein